jgi:hypothetical protein
MVGTVAAAAIPAIRRDHDNIPLVSLAYGGAEGPAQRIQLETFVHQVHEHFQRRQQQRRPARAPTARAPEASA